MSLKETRVVLIRWLIAGQRLEETVPTNRARHRRNELEAQGAVVYWSERLAESHWTCCDGSHAPEVQATVQTTDFRRPGSLGDRTPHLLPVHS